MMHHLREVSYKPAIGTSRINVQHLKKLVCV